MNRQYSILGYTKLVFANQMFESSTKHGTYVTGPSRIAYLHIGDDVHPWNNLGIVFCFVIAIRVVHFLLLWVHVYPYVKHQLEWSKYVSMLRIPGVFSPVSSAAMSKQQPAK